MIALARLALAAAGLVALTACEPIPPAAVPQGTLMNWEARPTYRTQNLRSGFEPDPVQIRIEAGGNEQVPANPCAATRGNCSPPAEACAGYVNARAPDVDLNLATEAGSTQPGQRTRYRLYFYVRANVDTTLVVFGPDRRWYCNDDGGGAMGANPVVVLNGGLTGNYNVWVGTYDPGRPVAATLYISERAPASGGGLK